MLPTLTARDIEEGIRSFVEREFPIATTGFREGDRSMVVAFLADKENFIKGPWLEVRRPFRKVDADMRTLLPNLSGKYGVEAALKPYKHQMTAFGRLGGEHPRSTIVATGTGSGKTECFLLPIVDAVLRRHEEGKPQGIKAIVIYPMNALATDQSRRFAKICTKIRDAGGPPLTVGLYTGAPGDDTRTMGETACITDHETLRAYPPDILLTNYKMLDYLLLRDADRALWKTTTAETLRYLVVDELHTFDGAQGTDLACLIRRLRDHLGIEDGLACVGTSATLGGGEASALLRRYAAEVFGADFSEPEAVITEDRLSLDEYLATFGEDRWAGDWPTAYDARQLVRLGSTASVESFIELSIRIWLNRRVVLNAGDRNAWLREALELGRDLPHHEAFRRLMGEADGLIHLEMLAGRWRREVPQLRDLDDEETLLLIRSLVALISMARVEQEVDGKIRIMPFLSVRVQLWVKELTNMLATVEAVPKVVPQADVVDTTPMTLPLVTCRDCNATAWGALMRTDEISASPQAFYQAWFSRDANTRLFYPVTRGEFESVRKEFPEELMRLCPKRKQLQWVNAGLPADEIYDEKCPICGQLHDPVIVRVPKIVKEGKNEQGRYVRMTTNCPWCGSVNSMRIFGARSATLSAAMTGHLHSSDANDDRKLISFSDSVQDAAHRAGFMEARSYVYTLRQAVAGLMRDAEGDRLDFEGFLAKLADFWKDRVGGRRELTRSVSPRVRAHAEELAAARFVSTFIPSSMMWMRSWTAFTDKVSEYREHSHAAEKNPIEGIIEILPGLLDEDKKPSDWAKMVNFVALRLRWEAFMEMSKRSHAGRTVELTGIGAVEPDDYVIGMAARELIGRLEERVGGLAAGTPDRDRRVERFIEGFLIHQKLRGCFDVRLTGELAPLDDFARFVRTGEDYFFNRSLFLPTYGQVFRPPAPLVMRKWRGNHPKFFDAVLPDSASGETWYTLWLSRTLGCDIDITAARDEIYATLLDVLVSVGAASRVDMEERGREAYLLTPRTWLVKRRLARAVCPHCGRWHMIDAERADVWRTMPCLSKGCMSPGHDVKPVEADETTYRGMPTRTMAREHTGNLDHIERGRIERSFIEGTEPWEVNLLSATSTLEMGIDIGDLSSVLLASMPPEPANYVQRIGRAGRRDGNALAMTVCDSGPHAQYFWADPEKMLDGVVEPPGVFLHAMAVMERQLFAFSITRWMNAFEDASIPKDIGDVLSAVQKRDEKDGGYAPESFPFGLLDFVKDGAEGLLADFEALFSERTPDGRIVGIFTTEEKARLRAFLLDEPGDETGAAADTPSIRTRLLGKLRGMLLEREKYRKKREQYASLAKQLEKQPKDERTEKDIEEFRAAADALKSLIDHEFKKKNTLNVLTDEGVLPNYAFPEEGIKIDGVVMKYRDRRGKDEKAESENEDGAGKTKTNVYKRFSFQRAASHGLFEVAPGNNFYVNEFILHVDQVDLRDENVTFWRFCPSCSHCEQDAPVGMGSACPRCGDPAWREQAQVRPVLQLKNVYAWADIRRDRISDDREDRVRVEHSGVKLIDIDPRVERRGFVTEGSGGFGFEYVPSITLRDFNFGKAATEEGPAFDVASFSVKAPGFRVCRHCGRLKNEVRINSKGQEYEVGRRQHDISCPAEKDPAKEDWIDGLVLFREFKSEALRIRVPQGLLTESFAPSTVAASLNAALKLGLRRYFHGSVDHLQVTTMDEPEEGGKQSVRYIVVYDTVPGGTGYLKELLSDGKKLIDLFKTTLEVLNECACGEDPDADGCYRCLYQYGNARIRRDISRRCAVEVLTSIVSKGPTLREGTLRGSGDEPEAVDSELERLFLVALRQAKSVFESVKRVPLGGGLFYYVLKTRTGRVWRVDPQVDVPGEVPSRPDFVIRPGRDAEQCPERTMAVFTDGWRWHHDIVADDFRKRQSLMNRGLRVWSLLWDDVEPLTHPEGDDRREKARCALVGNVPSEVQAKYEQWRLAMAKSIGVEYPEWARLRADWLGPRTSFDRLTAWLLDPVAAERMAEAAAFAHVLVKLFSPEKGWSAETGAMLDACGLVPDAGKPAWLQSDVMHAAGVPLWRTAQHLRGRFGTAMFLDAEAVKGAYGTPAAAGVEASLRAFWALAASMQFTNALLLLPAMPTDADLVRRCAQMPPFEEALPRLREGVALAAKPEGEAASRSAGTGRPAEEKAAFEGRWTEAKELLPDELHPLADALRRLGVPVDPDAVGVDLEDEVLEEVYGTAEILWTDAKLAVVLDPGREAGWEEAHMGGVLAVNGALDAERLAARIAEMLGAARRDEKDDE